ncbi:hypothetical protein NL676_004634 [Syzygium grande]|nr:hypothetical protein NL676_004634 [Syzygium grande]
MPGNGEWATRRNKREGEGRGKVRVGRRQGLGLSWSAEIDPLTIGKISQMIQGGSAVAVALALPILPLLPPPLLSAQPSLPLLLASLASFHLKSCASLFLHHRKRKFIYLRI